MTTLRSLSILTLFLVSFSSFANLCQGYIDLAQSNAAIGIGAVEKAHTYYENAVQAFNESRYSDASIALKIAEGPLSQGRLQLVTSLFQLERARSVCEGTQEIDGLSTSWNQQIQDLDKLESLVERLEQDILQIQ